MKVLYTCTILPIRQENQSVAIPICIKKVLVNNATHKSYETLSQKNVFKLGQPHHCSAASFADLSKNIWQQVTRFLQIDEYLSLTISCRSLSLDADRPAAVIGVCILLSLMRQRRRLIQYASR